jgi:hypothetical protein
LHFDEVLHRRQKLTLGPIKSLRRLTLAGLRPLQVSAPANNPHADQREGENGAE